MNYGCIYYLAVVEIWNMILDVLRESITLKQSPDTQCALTCGPAVLLAAVTVGGAGGGRAGCCQVIWRGLNHSIGYTATKCLILLNT